MSVLFRLNPTIEDHLNRLVRIAFDLSIVHNAVPASKKQASDLPGVCYINTEGKLEANAIEDITGLAGYTAPVDATAAILDVMLANIGKVRKVYSISVSEVTSVAGALTVTNLGASNGLTAAGNIALEIATASLDLVTEDPTFRVEIVALLDK